MRVCMYVSVGVIVWYSPIYEFLEQVLASGHVYLKKYKWRNI